MYSSSKDLDLELPVSIDYKCRYVTLENGIGGLLIHDPAADKAGMSVAVPAGSSHDPEDVEGLAHFLEHMLFLGTEKYPEESSYLDFISSNGGDRNAFTASTATVYFQSIKTDKLPEAVDRLSEFFISPLFTESATDREIHAIDNEFNRAKELPVWKRHVLFSALATPENPEHKFTIGNLATLGQVPAKDLRERLLAFYRAYYLPAGIRVVIISKHSLDELGTLFCNAFNAVPKSPEGVEPLGIKTEREAREKKGTKWFKSGMEVHTVFDPKKLTCVLRWELERGLDNYRLNPGDYFSHLIGHEGEGSVAYYLKKEGIIHNLLAGCENESRYSLFTCMMEFTDEGWVKREEAVTAVFEYIDMMRKAGPQEWVFNEMSGSSKASFLCSPKNRPEYATTQAALNLLKYSIDDVFYGEGVYRGWNPEIINRFMEYFTPENCTIAYSSPEYKDTCTDTIKHFALPYSMAPISESFLARLRSAVDSAGKFHLPDPNPYIPSLQSLSIKGPLTEKGSTTFRAPSPIYTTAQSLFYHKQDRTFGTPKVFVKVNVYPQKHDCSERDKAITVIVKELIKDAFMSWTYQAEVARIVYSIEISGTGTLTLSVESYNDKFALFTKRLLEEVRAYQPSEERFDGIKEKCILDMESSFVNLTGTTIARSIATHCIRRGTFLAAMVLEALKTLTLDDVTAWLKAFWASGVKVAGYIQGAISEEDAKAFAAEVERVVDAPVAGDIHRIVVGSIPAGCDKVLDVEVPNEKETNSCVHDIFQVGRAMRCPDEVTSAICANLVAEIMDAAAFQTLRTEEQLGYLVWVSARTENGMKYINMIIMSASHPPRYVDSRIEEFIIKFRKTLEEMPEAEFEGKRAGFASHVMENYKSVAGEFSDMKNEFFDGSYLWQRKKVATEIVMGLTKDDVIKMYDEVLLDKRTRRKLSIQLHSRAHKDDKIELCDIRDPKCFYNEFTSEWDTIQPKPNPFFPEEQNLKFNEN